MWLLQCGIDKSEEPLQSEPQQETLRHSAHVTSSGPVYASALPKVIWVGNHGGTNRYETCVPAIGQFPASITVSKHHSAQLPPDCLHGSNYFSTMVYVAQPDGTLERLPLGKALRQLAPSPSALPARQQEAADFCSAIKQRLSLIG